MDLLLKMREVEMRIVYIYLVEKEAHILENIILVSLECNKVDVT